MCDQGPEVRTDPRPRGPNSGARFPETRFPETRFPETGNSETGNSSRLPGGRIGIREEHAVHPLEEGSLPAAPHLDAVAQDELQAAAGAAHTFMSGAGPSIGSFVWEGDNAELCQKVADAMKTAAAGVNVPGVARIFSVQNNKISVQIADKA